MDWGEKRTKIGRKEKKIERENDGYHTCNVEEKEGTKWFEIGMEEKIGGW